MKTKIVVILFCIVLFNQTMLGWGRQGHIIVGEIAYRYLSEAAKIQLKKYLKDQSLAGVANWMDAIKAKQPETAAFHFTNSDNPIPPNLQTELQRVITALREYGSRKESEVNIDIKYAVHLTGDLHQPLHCGYASDKGGNKVNVVFNGETLSLHHIWDSDLIEDQDITAESCYNLYSTLSQEEINNIRKIDVKKWVEESRSYLDWIYKFDKKKPISSAYTEKAGEIITLQLLKSGLRLAAILNEAFKTGPQELHESRETINKTASLKAVPKRNFNNIETGEELFYIEYPHYSVGYSETYKIPLWTYYELTKPEQLNCVIARKGSFKQDKAQDLMQATKDDYTVKVNGKVYEKGHMVPCESMTFDCDAMGQTFLYTNCAPQTEKLNTGPWHTLETYINDWAIDHGKLLVFTGNIINSGSRKVGANNVGVPDSCFKIVVVYTDKEVAGIAFVMPNIQKQLDTPIHYVRTIDQVEAATGFDFFADWKEAEQKKVETTADPSLWNFNKNRYEAEKNKNCLKYNKEHPGEKCSCKVKPK